MDRGLYLLPNDLKSLLHLAGSRRCQSVFNFDTDPHFMVGQASCLVLVIHLHNALDVIERLIPDVLAKELDGQAVLDGIEQLPITSRPRPANLLVVVCRNAAIRNT